MWKKVNLAEKKIWRKSEKSFPFTNLASLN